MTYVVTENCIKCKYMDCIEVCPVDCFYVGENMLVINPEECIDCGVCEPECPLRPSCRTAMTRLAIGSSRTGNSRRSGQTSPARANHPPTRTSGRTKRVRQRCCLLIQACHSDPRIPGRDKPRFGLRT